MNRQILTLSLATLFSGTAALSGDQILHTYQSVRTQSMGGIQITTGLYDQAFFGNPARVVANPVSKVIPLSLHTESNGAMLGNIGNFVSSLGSNNTNSLISSVSENNHARFQMNLANFHVAAGEGKIAYSFGILMSTQADLRLQRYYQVDPGFTNDVQAVATVGMKLLDDNSLAVGISPHVSYRLAGTSLTLIDLLKNTSSAITSAGSQGMHFDVDLGATYVLPGQPFGWKITTGAVLNNVLGGDYTNLGGKLIPNITANAPAQPRALGFGASAMVGEFWQFTQTTFALEFNDIGNNGNGSLFRTIHIGAEARWNVILARLGINQGYFTAGLGFDLGAFQLEAATYGEEMSLNAGGLQDRRYTLRFGLAI